MSDDRQRLHALIEATPGLAAALRQIVEKITDRGGRLPTGVTVIGGDALFAALSGLFTPRFTRRTANGRIRVDLGAYARDLGEARERTVVETLFAVTGGRADGRAAGRDRRLELERGLLSQDAHARSPTSRAFLERQLASLGAPDAVVVTLAEGRGVDAALALTADVVRCIDGLAHVTETIRVQTFAARHLGNSKSLRRGGELHRWVGEALIEHDPRTVTLLEDLGVFPSVAAYRAFALEAHGVLFDEAAASVLCFGPIVYRKQSESFDHVARHARRGESSKLLVQQLRDAELSPPDARRITVFENLAPYLEYVDACAAREQKDEIVVCAGGQANLAVVALLKRLVPFRLPARYLGDLDRSGVLIHRSLRQRTGMPLAPWFMDTETHRRFADRGQPVAADERGRLRRLLARDDAADPGHELLRAIAESKIWIEQEAFSEEVLDQLVAR